jgi:hypothetical protein
MQKTLVSMLALASLSTWLSTSASGQAQGTWGATSKSNSVTPPAQLPAPWRAYLLSPSMFRRLDDIQVDAESRPALSALYARFRSLIEKTLIATRPATDMVTVAPDAAAMTTRRDDVRLRASALWVGVRLDAGRALLANAPDERNAAAKRVLRYLRDVRNCLRAFPPALLEEGDVNRGQRRTHLWNQAISEFDSYEADARAVLGSGADTVEEDDSQIRASLWLLKQFGPYNSDESTDNARLMQKTSDQFREVERLAKQAVAIRVQASVALMKVYGWPPDKGKDAMQRTQPLIAAPDGLSIPETQALGYSQDFSQEREGHDAPVKGIHSDLVNLIGETASGSQEGVARKFARTRKALGWMLVKSLFLPRSGNQQAQARADADDLFDKLVQGFDHRGLWGKQGLDWTPPEALPWKFDSQVPKATIVATVQERLRAWLDQRPNPAQTSVSSKKFVDQIVLQFEDVTPVPGQGEFRQWHLLGWPEQLVKMHQQWDAMRELILADQRLSNGNNSATAGPQYVSVASHHLYELRGRIHALRLRADGAQGQAMGQTGGTPDVLRDSDFGRLHLMPSSDEDYLNGLTADEQRLLMIREAMAKLYGEITKDTEQRKKMAKKGLEEEMSRRLADFFALRWAIDRFYHFAPDERAVWARGFLNRKVVAIDQVLAAE